MLFSYIEVNNVIRQFASVVHVHCVVVARSILLFTLSVHPNASEKIFWFINDNCVLLVSF